MNKKEMRGLLEDLKQEKKTLLGKLNSDSEKEVRIISFQIRAF